MRVHPATILELVDNIVLSETSDERDKRVERMRSILEGEMPSVVLQKLVIPGPSGSHHSLAAQSQRLSEQVAKLADEKAALEAKVNALQARLHEQTAPAWTPSDDGFCTMEQFMGRLTAKLRRSYGWRTDYISASHDTPGCTPVANEAVQKWQQSNKVPGWAVNQIERLQFRERHSVASPAWSSDDEDYLTNIFQENPLQSNAMLAERCAEHFGRHINENSIKGALDRQRKKHKLPPRRPNRATPGRRSSTS